MEILHERLIELYEDEKDKDSRCGRKQFANLCGISLFLLDNSLSSRGWLTFQNFKSIF